MKVVTRVLLVIVASVALAGEVRAQGTLAKELSGSAKQANELANQLWKDRKFHLALLKYQAAYAESKNPKLLWSILACHRAEEHYARALQSLYEYRDKTQGLRTTKDQRDLDDQLGKLGQMVSRVKLTIE